MSDARSAIRADRRHAYDKAVSGAAQVLADARQQMADLYARQGAAGVAEAAWTPGGPSKQELARRATELFSRSRERTSAA